MTITDVCSIYQIIPGSIINNGYARLGNQSQRYHLSIPCRGGCGVAPERKGWYHLSIPCHDGGYDTSLASSVPEVSLDHSVSRWKEESCLASPVSAVSLERSVSRVLQNQRYHLISPWHCRGRRGKQLLSNLSPKLAEVPLEHSMSRKYFRSFRCILEKWF